jgi:hypothetical protein
VSLFDAGAPVERTQTGERKASRAMINLAIVRATERGLTDRTTRLAAACSVLAAHGYPERAERGLRSFTDLSKGEAHVLIEAWAP